MFWEHLFPDCLLQSAGSHDSDHCPLVFGCWIIKQGSQDSALNPFGLRKMISRGFLRRHGIPLLQLDAPSIIWQEKSGPWPKDCRAGSKRKLVMLTISWGWQGKSFITPRNSPGYLWFITHWDMVAHPTKEALISIVVSSPPPPTHAPPSPTHPKKKHCPFFNVQLHVAISG